MVFVWFGIVFYIMIKGVVVNFIKGMVIDWVKYGF